MAAFSANQWNESYSARSRYQRHGRRRRPNMYEKRLQAQKRNKAYKRRGRSSRSEDQIGDDHDGDPNVGGNSDDENESVDSLKKWKKHKSEFDALFIPSDAHNEVYSKNGYIFNLTATRPLRSPFNLNRFISAITSRRSLHRVHRSKLLKVEVLSSSHSMRLRVTVSSPSVFHPFLSGHFHSDSIRTMIDDTEWMMQIPSDSLTVDAMCCALMLCINPLSAAQDLAVWSSRSEWTHHPMAYLVENKESVPGVFSGNNRLFLFCGGADHTEYRLTVDPKDIYFAEWRHDKERKTYSVKLRLLRPCSVSILAISVDDERCGIDSIGNGAAFWVNPKGKIYRECGNESIYSDPQRRCHEAIYHRHISEREQVINERLIESEDEGHWTALDVIPKVIGKALILYLEFTADSTSPSPSQCGPRRLLQWLEHHRPHYDYLSVSDSLIAPAQITAKNEYRDNLLRLRGGQIVDAVVMEHVDQLLNGAHIADECIIEEQEVNDQFVAILTNALYKNRFIGGGVVENVHHSVIRNALQYFNCFIVERNPSEISGVVKHRKFTKSTNCEIFTKKC